MITLSYPLFESSIDFNDNIVKVIVIENPTEFLKFETQLLLAMEDKSEELALFKNHEEIQFKKYFEVITDVFSLDKSNKKIINKLYAKLQELAYQEDMYLKTCELEKNINEYVINLSEFVDCNLDYEQVDLLGVFKSVNLKITDDNISFIEKLCDFVDVFNEFLKINYFVFINLKSYLNDEELQEFYKFVSYKKINLLLLENHQRNKLPNENLTIIDNDLCEIY